MMAVPTMVMPAAMMVMAAPVNSGREITCMLCCRGRRGVGKRERLSAVSRHRERHQASDNRKT
jgi:hypothetical protein